MFLAKKLTNCRSSGGGGGRLTSMDLLTRERRENLLISCVMVDAAVASVKQQRISPSETPLMGNCAPIILLKFCGVRFSIWAGQTNIWFSFTDA
jgi:hypothetical protein